MIIRILIGGVVAILLAVLGTLSAVGLKKTSDLDKELVKTTRQIKENEAELRRLQADFAEFEKKFHTSGKPTTHWEYEGAFGPEAWGKSFPTCASGKAQSPVDIAGSFVKATAAIKHDYKAGSLRILNDGHAVQINIPPGSTLKVDSQTYDLTHIRMHRPSQTKIAGKPMAMEMHFFHKDATGKLLVLGVLMRESAVQNRAMWAMWKHIPAKETAEMTITGVSFNPANLLPDSLGYYAYEGSLTAPPCTEGVQYLILKSPIGVQREMIDSFPFQMNARPVQPLNDRKISAS